MIGRLKAPIQFDRKPIQLARKFFKKLPKQLGKAFRQYFEDETQLALFESKVQGLIEQLIYSVYEPEVYTRTYRLLRSFRATGTGNLATSEISVWSDPSISPAKTLPHLSYAAFFERPEEFNTFIQPRDHPVYPINKRPFFNALTALTQAFTEQQAQDAIIEALNEVLPPELRA